MSKHVTFFIFKHSEKLMLEKEILNSFQSELIIHGAEKILTKTKF